VCVKVSEKAKLMTMIEPEVADVVVGKCVAVDGARAMGVW